MSNNNNDNDLAARILGEDAIEEAQEKLDKITKWIDAYPLRIFPEPESESNMRYVLDGIKKIIESN